MKTVTLSLLSFALVGLIGAAERRPSTLTPQPRVRLDPATRSAIPEPVRRSPEPATAGSPYLLERLVVKERSVLPLRPPAVEDPTGRFTPVRGGRFTQQEVGPVRVEIGVWPWIDLFAEEARFADQVTRVSVDVVRMKW